jgi:hypothetical protein
MPNTEQKDMDKAIRVIQDIAVMITGASEYVCEKRMLKRYSSDIEANLDNLEAYLSWLKGSFPGIFPEVLNPDSSLAKLKEIASSMKADDSAIEATCRAGDLGDELFLVLKELKTALRDISNTLGGKVASPYRYADRIADLGGRFKSLFAGISAFLSTIAKIIIAVVIALILSFVYLYATMESEDTLVASINNVITSIQTQKDTLAKQRKEYEEIAATIDRLKNKKLARVEKIQLLNLSTESQRMKEHISEGVLLLEKREKELAHKRKNLEKLQKATFIQKLLKR